LTYRHPYGRAGGVVVIESADLLHARLKASLAGADRELGFASGHRLDPVSAEMIPANMVGRFLDDRDLPAWATSLTTVETKRDVLKVINRYTISPTGEHIYRFQFQ
jgi:hypothetical protein